MKLYCENCANTGILNAHLIKEDGQNRAILVKLCKEKHNNDAQGKNLHLLSAVGLPLEIVKN